MYIIELLIKYLKNKPYIKRKLYDPLNSIPDGLEESSDNCEHLFLPLDSTNETFACKYCGLIVPKEKLKNKNIFEKKSIK